MRLIIVTFIVFNTGLEPVVLGDSYFRDRTTMNDDSLLSQETGTT